MTNRWKIIFDHEIQTFQICNTLPSLGDKTNQLQDITKKIEKHQSELPLLYRYSPANYWNIRSLEQQKLVLRPASEMNDIFEGDVVTSLHFADMSEKIKGFQKGTYLKSLSDKELDLQMFAHYGDDFKGMCVEYDFTQCEEIQINKGQKKKSPIKDLFPVIYAEKQFESVEPESLENNRFFFLKKAKAWEYESEWRFIRVVEDETKQKQEQSVDVRGCIKTIYLGPRMEDVKKEHIKEIAKKINAQVKEVMLSDGKFALEAKGENDEHLNLR